MSAAAQQDEDILARLRQATRPVHARLDGALGLADAGVTLRGYQRTLEKFYGFWQSWEPLAARLLDDEALLQPRRRRHLLAADLLALGTAAADLPSLPVCPPPDLQNAAQALGSLYVLEGSTLGGQVIKRNIEARLGVISCGYFNGYGKNTGPMWRAFLQRLSQAPTSDAAQISAGAVTTFECLAGWLI